MMYTHRGDDDGAEGEITDEDDLDLELLDTGSDMDIAPSTYVLVGIAVGLIVAVVWTIAE